MYNLFFIILDTSHDVILYGKRSAYKLHAKGGLQVVLDICFNPVANGFGGFYGSFLAWMIMIMVIS
jgi:hypothetical protein